MSRRRLETPRGVDASTRKDGSFHRVTDPGDRTGVVLDMTVGSPLTFSKCGVPGSEYWIVRKVPCSPILYS